MSTERVRFYDSDTREVTEIPASDLPKTAALGKVEGVDGEVWIDAARLRFSPVRDITFTDTQKGRIKLIHDVFREHLHDTYEAWEEGFKRDADPDSEIRMWIYAAKVYIECVADRNGNPITTHEERREIFKVIAFCLANPQEALSAMFPESELLGPERVKEVVMKYYGKEEA